MKKDHSSEENAGEENFEQLLNESYKEPFRLEPGQKIEAVVVKITAEWAFLAVGGKGEGYVDRKELLDADGNLTVKEGDKVRAWFQYSDNGEMHFTTRIGSGPSARAQLQDAFRNRIQVEGTVTKEMKGGFEITILGGARAFCPFSHMGIRRDESKENYLGVQMAFDIIECGDRNVVLSRKDIVEKEKKIRIDALKASLREGDKVRGTVTSIQNFGAFVDIGGVEGLLPVSELAWNRTEKVSDLLSAGQIVDVVIKKLDWQNGRLSFSLKDALPNPWDKAAETWPAGSYQKGTVSRLAPFGAFVTLGEGVDGLIHVSKMSSEKRVQHPDELFKVGQTVEVKVESVDLKNKKISLVPADISREAEEDAAVMKNYQREETAGQETFGTLGEVLKNNLKNKNR